VCRYTVPSSLTVTADYDSRKVTAAQAWKTRKWTTGRRGMGAANWCFGDSAGGHGVDIVCRGCVVDRAVGVVVGRATLGGGWW